MDQARQLVAAVPADANATDLVGAFLVASHRFEGATSARRLLVVWTDGIQTAPPVNLLAVTLDPAGIAGLLDDLEASRLVPSLPGVEVRMAGVGVGVPLDPARLVAVEEWWRRFIERAGGRLTRYDKDTRL